MKTMGIYKIESPSGKVYIGQSRRIEDRWSKHRMSNKTTKLNSSLAKYGHQNHIFSIIHILPKDIDQQTFDRYEQLYMDLYSECGLELLNIKKAGSNGLFSDESKYKMRLAHLGKPTWNKGLKNYQVAWNKGKSIPFKTYEFLKNGEYIKIDNLKLHCIDNNLDYTSLIHLHRGTGYYGKVNKYKEYSKIK